MVLELNLNKPIIVRRGWEADVEVNQMHAYFGEWAVIRLPLTEKEFAEVRMPLDVAMDLGVIVDTEQMLNDYEEMV